MTGIKHAFTSTKGDPADATYVKPSNWNADHVLGDGSVTLDSSGGQLTLSSTEAFSGIVSVNLSSGGSPTLGTACYHSTPSTGDAGYFVAYSLNSASTIINVAVVACGVSDVTAGSENTYMQFRILSTGATVSALSLLPTAVTVATPFIFKSYAKASLPSASPAAQMVYVTDAAGGAQPFFSDGAEWRRVTDRTTVT